MAAFATVRADDGRRRRRPVASRPRPSSPAATSASRAEHARPQRLLRRARARHGRGRQRHGRARRDRAAVRLDVPAVRRLHARPIRLSALMGLPVAWVFTHDSVALGEDGPTHQPVEHLAALRAIPGLVVIRPADANETAEAWRVILEDLEGPAVLVALAPGPAGPRPHALAPRRRRAAAPTCCADADDAAASCSSRTGAEVCDRARRRATCSPPRASRARVVSMPSWELFAAQDDDYRDDGAAARRCRRSRVEAGVTMGWERWVDASRRRSTASAPRRPGAEVLEKLGITAEHVAAGRQGPARARASSLGAPAAPAALRAGRPSTWIAAGSRTQAMRSSAVRRSSQNWKRLGLRGRAVARGDVEGVAGGVQRRRWPRRRRRRACALLGRRAARRRGDGQRRRRRRRSRDAGAEVAQQRGSASGRSARRLRRPAARRQRAREPGRDARSSGASSDARAPSAAQRGVVGEARRASPAGAARARPTAPACSAAWRPAPPGRRGRAS